MIYALIFERLKAKLEACHRDTFCFFNLEIDLTALYCIISRDSTYQHI